MSVLKNSLSPLAAVLFGLVGWFGKDIQINGVNTPVEPMLVGGLSIGGIWMLLTAMMTNYRKAGGVLDGKLTPNELSSILKTLADQFAPALSPYVDGAAKVAAPVVNKLVAPTAVELIDSISRWFTDKTPDANEQTLNHKLLDILSEAVKSDAEGAAAAATLRARMHDVSQRVSVEVA